MFNPYLHSFLLLGCLFLNLSLGAVGAVPSISPIVHDSLHRAVSSGLGPCHHPLQRKEWRRLSDPEKKAYLDAVVCLMHLPSVASSEKDTIVKTRFDDFQALHVGLTYEVHWVGQFLPWHRRFVSVYEQTLRRECGYEGANPYWDWTLDADTGTIANSPIFSPSHGFGGNGAYIPDYRGPFNNLTFLPGSGGGCIQDGPFTFYNLSIGPGTLQTNHCITRAINDHFLEVMTSSQVANTTKQSDFESFRMETGGAFKPPPFKVHDGGHGGVNGEMANTFSSPGDPLFYLHHANLDRIWAIWQSLDSPARLKDISGYTTFEPPYENITLDFGLKMGRLAPTIPVGEVMDTKGKELCYEYV